MPFPRPSLGSPRLIISLRSCSRRGASNQKITFSLKITSICIRRRRERENSLIPYLFVKKIRKTKREREKERRREKKNRRRRNVTAFHQWRPFEFEVANTRQKAKRGREHRGRRRTNEKVPDFFLFYLCLARVKGSE